MVVCVQCLQLREQSLMKCVFNTGFRIINGISYRLGVCKDCPGTCSEVHSKVVEPGISEE